MMKKTKNKATAPSALNALKAKIHIAKASLGLDEATYRDVLLRTTGKDSCRLMQYVELVALMNEFKRLGFVAKPTAYAKKSHAKAAHAKSNAQAHAQKSHPALMAKIHAILSDLGLPWAYAETMAQKMFGIDCLQKLDGVRLYKLTQALAIYQKRQRRANSQ